MSKNFWQLFSNFWSQIGHFEKAFSLEHSGILSLIFFVFKSQKISGSCFLIFGHRMATLKEPWACSTQLPYISKACKLIKRFWWSIRITNSSWWSIKRMADSWNVLSTKYLHLVGDIIFSKKSTKVRWIFHHIFWAVDFTQLMIVITRWLQM